MPRAQRIPHPGWQAPYPGNNGTTMQVPMHSSAMSQRSHPYYPHQHQAYGPGPAAHMSQQGYSRYADPRMQPQPHLAQKPGVHPQHVVSAQHSVGGPGMGPSSHAQPAGGPGAAGMPRVRYDMHANGSQAGAYRGAGPDPLSHATPIVAPVTVGPGRGAHSTQAPYAHSAAYGTHQQQAHAPAMASRIASANAAIAAIQSVAPPLVPPVPSNKPTMALLGLPQLPGGDLKGRIKFETSDATTVVDEVTAQKSAAEFSAFLGKSRRVRRNEWDDFWRHRLDLNRRILVMEDECFNEAQEDAADNEYSDEEDYPRRAKPVTVPYIYHNTGSFDIPPPRSVLMPDPEVIMLQMQQAQAQQAQVQHAHVQSHAQAQARAQQAHAQAQAHAQRSALSARQRAAQQVKPFRTY